ncbi:MAG: PAS domain-containing protein [Sphingomonadales bacterium]|nr:PAS domain-containing protein [Sphingomonadales bacterium]
MGDKVEKYEIGVSYVGDDVVASALSTPGAMQRGGIAFHALSDTMPHMVWSMLPDGRVDYFNDRWYDFTGLPVAAEGDEAAGDAGAQWIEAMHPDDRERAGRLLRESLATGEPFEDEYRRQHHKGGYRWVLGRALPIVNSDGETLRWIGTCTDIDDAKRIAEHNEILSRELSHRIKNIFAVISGLIGMTARANESFRGLARDLQNRIAALGRAHEFVRPHGPDSRPERIAVTLHGMLEQIFASYPAFGDGRLTIAGEDMEIDSRAATPVALVFHELATNSMKYGALSVDAGRVDIAIAGEGDDMVFHWRESGGPAVAGAPSDEGFGSRLTELAVRQQLGGEFEKHWLPEGLAMTMRARRDRLTE